MSSTCCGVSNVFDDAKAREDLESYRRKGPSDSTVQLIDALRERAPTLDTLLDIGGGVGAIAHELLANGVMHATLVDGSASYLDAAREEGAHRSTNVRLELRKGDIVAIAADVGPADVVTLDKVVCCYEDMDALLAVSAERARRLYGIVYPRDDWWVRLFIAAENAVRRLKGNDFRGFVHANSAIDAALRRAGLTPRFNARGAWWIVAVYERVGASPSST